MDSGMIVAFYNPADQYHQSAVDFFTSCNSQLITTVGCVTESVFLLSRSWQIQNRFLNHLASKVYTVEPLTPDDFLRIAELNEQYADLPGDFADLSLVAISERLNIAEIATLDKDFDIYRRYRTKPFNRIFYPSLQ